MWLWYLELYVFALLAFALGAGAGLAGVRLAVRRRADDPALVTQPTAAALSPAAASATKPEATT